MFKKALVFLFIMAISLFGFEYKLEPKKISKDVWCFFGELDAPTIKNGGNMSNSCYIKTKDSYVLVDSGVSYSFAKEAYAAMSKIDKLPVSIVISSHSHDDHWLGNSFYKEKFGAKILGPSLINKENSVGGKTRIMNLLPQDIMKDTKIVLVDEEILETKSIIIGEKKIDIIPVGVKAHTSEDLIIYLEDDKLLFSGDVVMNGRVTSNRDGSVIGQLKALDKIDSIDWQYLVAGHGLDTSKNATKQIRDYFTLIKTRVLKAIEDEVEAQNISKVVTMDEFKDVAMFDMFNSRNVFDAYRELEFYEE